MNARVTATTATCLDHILTNENRYVLTPAAFECSITDHYPIMVFISCKLTVSSIQSKYVRSLKKLSIKNFNTDLQIELDSVSFDIFNATSTNINAVFDKFYSAITKTIDKHVPLKKLSKKQKRLQRKPWITKDLLISIKRKQKMHKSHFIHGSIDDKKFYKLYSNLLTKLKDLAKKAHYHHLIEEHKRDPKKTWKVLRTLLPSKPASPRPDIITSHNTTVSDPIIIANEFNHHFSNVGNVLTNNIDNSDANSFISYLKHSCPSTIFVYPTTYHEIISLISAFKLNKVEGHDDIPPYFLKIAAEIIAIPLAMILNLCMQFDIFPNKLKIAKVLPVYKSGPTEHVTNYRPISLLTSLSKIFERVILNRLLPFLERNNIIPPTQF